MSYKLSRRLFVIAAVVCTLLRIVIHRACIDPSTGFYMGNRAFTMTYSFLILAAILLFFVSGLSHKPQNPQIPVLPPLRFSALLGSIGILILAVPSQSKIYGPNYLPLSRFGIVIRLIGLSALPLVAAVLLIYFAVKSSKEKMAHINGYLAMIPCLWMAAVLVTRFMDYTASRHVSDQMLSIVAMGFGTLFFLAFGRFAAGADLVKAGQQTAAFAYPFSLAALSAGAGILIGPQASIPLALSIPEAVAFLLLGIFAGVTGMYLEDAPA